MKFSAGIMLGGLLALNVATASESKLAKPGVINTKIDPQLLYRQNDRLTSVLLVNYDNGKRSEHWSSVDCNSKQIYRLYWDLYDENDKLALRHYGESYGRYAPPQLATSAAEKKFAALCQLPLKNSDWVIAEKADDTQDTTLIDVANLHKVGNILMARVGYGYAEIQYDPPYDAPYDLKIENHLYHCDTGEDTLTGAVDVSPEGFITDSLTGKMLQRRVASFKTSPALSSTLAHLCTLPAPAEWKGKGQYQSAPDKPVSKVLGPIMPDFSDNNPDWLAKFAVPAEISQQATGLVKNWAEPKFSRLRFTILQANDTPVEVILDRENDGLIRRYEQYKVFQGQRIMLANIVQLKGAISLSHTPSILQTLKTTLRFPLWQGQRFSIESVSKSENNTRESRYSEQCAVVSRGEAREINPAFSGQYWRVECEEDHSGKKEKSVKAWLSDLNLFLPLERSREGVMEPVTYRNIDIRR